jgi:hypothetical protein
MSPEKYEEYLELYHHLSGMPSAKEMENANGYSFGKLFSKLLQTNEEQARYIVQLNDKEHALENRVAELEAKMTKLVR